MQRVAARGNWGTVEWAIDSGGRMPAREVFDDLSNVDRAKIIALFQRLAADGGITNREKFKQLGEKAGPKARGLWEFKSFQRRFLGDFRPGRRFLVAHGFTKKKDGLKRADINRAIRILDENDAYERSHTK